jgi:hypothetical protein
VLGAGAVMVVDASQMKFTDSHAVVRGQPVAMIGLKLDFLTTGCRYDLKRRQGITPPPMLHPEPIDRRSPQQPPLMTERAMDVLLAERAEDGAE